MKRNLFFLDGDPIRGDARGMTTTKRAGARRSAAPTRKLYRLRAGHRNLIEKGLTGPVVLSGNGQWRAAETLRALGLARVRDGSLVVLDAARARLEEERRLEAERLRRVADPVGLFWSKVEKTEGCWLWREGLDKDGYGRFQVTIAGTNSQRHLRAHRYSFELAHGRRPSKYVLHSCDNPACVNPAHLREGTAADNARDAIARGRHTSQRGSK